MAFPSNPSANDTHVEFGKTYTFDGVKWKAAAEADLPSITASGSEPTGTPSAGQVWYNTNEDVLMVYTGTEWIKSSVSLLDSEVSFQDRIVAKVGIGETYTNATATGNLELDFDQNQNFILTLTGALTLDNPTMLNATHVGQGGFISFRQDGTGSRTVGLGSLFKTTSGSGLTLSTDPSSVDYVPYTIVSTTEILLGTPQLAFA